MIAVVLLLAVQGTQSSQYDVESRDHTHWPTENKITEAEALIKQGEYDKGIAMLHEALKVLPKHAQAAFLIGLAYASMAETSPDQKVRELSEEYYKRAIKLATNSSRFYNFATVAHGNVGNLIEQRGDYKKALWHFRQAAKRNMTGNHDPYRSAGLIYEKLGMVERAKAMFRKSVAITREDALTIHLPTILPLVYDSQEDFERVARDFVRDVRRLNQRRGLEVANPARELFNVPHYYLAYHGYNYATTIAQLGEIIRRTNPELRYVSPHARAGKTNAPGAKIRVGWASMFFRTHSAGFIEGTISHLDRERFEVVVFALREPWKAHSDSDPVTKRIRERADRWIDVPKLNVPHMRALVEAERVDVLVFVEIGMDPGNYALAMNRIAPVQVATHGHASTTGLATIDYFVSYEMFEPAVAQSHYSEPLVSLADFQYYRKPSLSTTYGQSGKMMSAAELWARLNVTVTPTTRVYTCPQTLFKLTPDFDDVFRRILEADPNGILILKEYATSTLNKRLLKRLEKTAPGVVQRIIVTRALDDSEWLPLLRHASVVLDSYPFGGYTTTLEAMSVGAPVVTLLHARMPGRCSAAFLALVNATELIATTKDEYVAIALRLAKDIAWRKRVVEKVRSGRGVLFERLGGVRAWERFLTEVATGSPISDLHTAKFAPGSTYVRAVAVPEPRQADIDELVIDLDGNGDKRADRTEL